jgi:hypothetical protein
MSTTLPKAAISIPLANSFDTNLDPAALTINGAHRFVKIAGKVGYQSQSQKTQLKLKTELHTGEHGSINLWLCPTESLGVAPSIHDVDVKDPHWQDYGLITDSMPTHDITNTIFAWYWRSYWHPQMVGKFMQGKAGNAAADFAVTPYVPVEHMPLHEREWYQLTFTWDKPNSDLRIYINGILCGTTRYPFECQTPRNELFIGNTSMVFADIDFFDVVLTPEQIQANYNASTVSKNAEVRHELLDMFTTTPKKAVDWTPDQQWQLKYESALTKQGDFDGWTQQGCTDGGFQIKSLAISDDGLLVETPNQVHVESRVYFWSPDVFEGDLAVEYEFKPLQDTGLALLVVQATGMQREDYMTDHPKRTTGSMGTIIADRVRNYHWEYFRHAVDVRNDVGGQILAKNPWQHPMAMSAVPLIETNKWHKLLFVQEGKRLRGAIDGQWVFDVMDDAFSATGAVLNSGRIGLRLMYNTSMVFKNIKVWNNNPIEVL